MRERCNVSHRNRAVKTRLSGDEYVDFTVRFTSYDISQSGLLRQATWRAIMRPIAHVSLVNDELLPVVRKPTAEYGRVGGNLNQIAWYLDGYDVPYNTLSGEVCTVISDLVVSKYEILKKVGDAVGNIQTH